MRAERQTKIGLISITLGIVYFAVGLLWIASDDLLNFTLAMTGLSYIGLGIYCLYDRGD